MVDIRKFLLERIAEDERLTLGSPDDRVQRERRECAFRRRIVELHTGDHDCPWLDARGYVRSDGFDDEKLCDTVIAAAMVYLDHRDFDPHWR